MLQCASVPVRGCGGITLEALMFEPNAKFQMPPPASRAPLASACCSARAAAASRSHLSYAVASILAAIGGCRCPRRFVCGAAGGLPAARRGRSWQSRRAKERRSGQRCSCPVCTHAHFEASPRVHWACQWPMMEGGSCNRRAHVTRASCRGGGVPVPTTTHHPGPSESEAKCNKNA